MCQILYCCTYNNKCVQNCLKNCALRFPVETYRTVRIFLAVECLKIVPRIMPRFLCTFRLYYVKISTVQYLNPYCTDALMLEKISSIFVPFLSLESAPTCYCCNLTLFQLSLFLSSFNAHENNGASIPRIPFLFISMKMT
jgi:hypothetical protein